MEEKAGETREGAEEEVRGQHGHSEQRAPEVRFPGSRITAIRSLVIAIQIPFPRFGQKTCLVTNARGIFGKNDSKNKF